MKKLSYLITTFVFATLGTIGVNAASISNVKLNCPSNIGTGERTTCSVVGDVDEDMTISKIDLSGDITASGQGKTVEQGTNKNLGSVTFTTPSNEGAATGDITVTSDTATGSGSYSVNIKSSDTSLSSIKVDGTVVSNGKITVEKQSVNISATAKKGQITSGTGTTNLSCGSNTISIKVTAPSGKTGTNTITVTRKCDTDKTLKNITLSTGTLSPAFSKNTKNYKVEVDSKVEKITINATKNNDKQTITGTGEKKLAYGDNKIEIVVKSEEGETTTYVITVTRKDDRNTEATLKSIKLSDGKIKFKKTTYDYTTKVLYEVTKIDVKAVATDKNAKVEITGNDNLKVGENIITIKVTSENEKETQEYRIKVTRLKEGEVLGDNAYIKSLKIKGYSIDFDKETLKYTIQIKKEKSLKFTVVMDEEGATYKILNNHSLKNGSVIKITTRSKDDSESLSYLITIEKNNKTILIAIIIISAIIAGGLIAFFIIMNKRKKNKIKEEIKNDNDLDQTITFKNDIKEDTIPANEDIILKANSIKKTSEELKKKENDIDIYSTILNEDLNTNSDDIYNTILNDNITKKTQDVDIYSTILNEDLNVSSNDDIYNTILNMDEPVKKPSRVEKRFEENKDEEREIATKVCSICGHKIPASTKICPYCRRHF